MSFVVEVIIEKTLQILLEKIISIVYNEYVRTIQQQMDARKRRSMAIRGEYIFTGYIKGCGMVRVFNDLDNTKFVFAESVKGNSQWYVSRSVVEPRKTKKNSTSSVKFANDSESVPEKIDEQLILF